MNGVTVFDSLAEAIGAGFQLYDRIPDGYLVRIKTAAGWATAIVICKVKR